MLKTYLKSLRSPTWAYVVTSIIVLWLVGSFFVHRYVPNPADILSASLVIKNDSLARTQRLLAISESENLSLRDRLRGWERTPTTQIQRISDVKVITRTDTVIVAMSINSAGTLERLLTDSTHTALLPAPVSVSNCDMGLRVASTHVDCLAPRVGHFSPFVEAGFNNSLTPQLEVGLSYKPTLRSSWNVDVSARPMSQELSLSVRKSFRFSF